MAIYGNFSDHAFSDVAKVLQRHSGTLFLQSALEGRAVELHLHEGEMRALFVDGFPVREAVRVQDIVRQLMASNSGTYEFEAMHPSALTTHFVMPLNHMLRSLAQDARIDSAQLPHEDTKFIAQNGADAIIASMALPIQSAWRNVGPLMRVGASANDVAREVLISVEEARLMMFQLRAAGAIVPYRAAGVVQSGALGNGAPQFQSQVPTAPEEKISPVRRFLNALRRFTGGA